MSTIAIAFALFVAIAALVALMADRSARNQAWRRIAEERRRLHEERLSTEAVVEPYRCPVCRTHAARALRSPVPPA